MILSLCIASAFATTLEVPTRFRYAEYTGWGEDPVVVDSALSATVAVAHPVTGASFSTAGSLFLQERLGQGKGELTFSADPANSVRTWAVYLLDATGAPLQAEPEIIDIAFGEGGDGTIAARASADIVVKSVKVKKRGSSRTDDGNAQLQITVSGFGEEAAFVGIVEVTADKAPLADHTDLESMTAEIYANYQELLLDAIVPLDTWRADFAGTIDVKGVSVKAGVVEAGVALDYDVTVYGPAVKGGGDALQVVHFESQAALEGKSKKATGEVQDGKRLALDSEDQVFEHYDGSMALVFAGDVRAYEISAELGPVDGATPPESSQLVVLDPSDVTLAGSATVYAAWPGSPEKAGDLDAEIVFLEKDGNVMDDLMGMAGGFGTKKRMAATASSARRGSEKLEYVGESLRDADGRIVFRGLNLTRTSDGTARLAVEVMGEKYAAASAVRFDFEDPTLGSITVPLAITETTFALDWTFPSDVVGMAYTLDLYVYGATNGPTVELVADGQYDFDVADDWGKTWETGEDVTGVYQHGCCCCVTGAIVVRSKLRPK